MQTEMPDESVIAIGSLAWANPEFNYYMVGGYNYKQIWGRLYWRRPEKSMGMRMAKGSKQDLNRMRNLVNGIEVYVDAYYDGKMSAEEAIDRINRLNQLAQIAEGRVLFGYEVMLDNAFDKTLDYLDFKPEIKAGLWLHQKLRWLIKLMDWIGYRPWIN